MNGSIVQEGDSEAGKVIGRRRERVCGFSLFSSHGWKKMG